MAKVNATVTAENLDEIKEALCRDQSEHVEAGCECWTGVGGCQITLWPNGRVAIAWNGASEWGWLDNDEIVIDDNYANCVYSRDGELLRSSCGQEINS